MRELAVVCESLGRVLAPVPFVATTCTGAQIAAHATSEQRQTWLPRIAAGDAVIAFAPAPSARDVRENGGRLTGRLAGVAWAHVADALAVEVAERVWLVDLSSAGVSTQRGVTTAREIALDIELADVAVLPLGPAEFLRERWRTALACLQAGITATALRMTADYTSAREQFGKPLSSFQGVALKAADGYVDVSSIRRTARRAAWALDTGAEATLAVLTAAWWAAEGGQHCLHITQHLHGGIGADISYPVHRYFLAGRQVELLLGGASALLAELGDALAATREAGDALDAGG
jgi:acyl-CoA dehydrogenase